jgi:hypothetical protein
MKKVLFLVAALVFCGSIFAQNAQESYWDNVNYHMYEDHEPFVAMMSLDNHLVMPDDNYAAYEVAAFVTVDGNELYRGHGFMKHYAGDPNPILEFEIFYQPIDGCLVEEGNPNETPLPVSFKLYDHSTGTLYEYWTCTVDIETQTQYNSYDFDVMPVVSFTHTFTKEIDPYTEEGGYYLIASPIDEVMAKDVVGLRTSDFDFYSFKQDPEDGKEWINHRTEAEYLLQPGVGYLYANSTGADLTFIGAPYNGDGTVTLEKKEGDNVEFSGWNLVGNPFAQKAYPNREFYVMNEDGSEIITAERDTVSAMEGIFVIAASDDEQMQFTTAPINSKGQIVLNVTQNRGNVVDRAIVRFGQGGTLPKFMLNENHTKMYIQMDDNDYAVVRSNKAGELPVNFEPAQNGTFTISVNTENLNVKYLHLIDRATGMDTDLLQTPSYKFDARTNDDPRRFVLVFKTSINIFDVFTTNSGNKGDFSFFSNGNWIINNDGEAVLQVVDVNGRILSSEEINGCVSKRIEAAPGVYMLRLVNGNDVKVQKIVVE